MNRAMAIMLALFITAALPARSQAAAPVMVGELNIAVTVNVVLELK